MYSTSKSKKKKSKEKKYCQSKSPQSEDEWVDCNTVTASVPTVAATLTRDSWMTMDFLDNIPTITKTKKDFKRPDPQDKLGNHERELNPYWKNGGHGLPTEIETTKQTISCKNSGASIGDGGLRWWEKALERCRQTAADERKSLEEVATERYGSLDFLYKKISECGGKSNHKNLLDFSKNKKFHRPSTSQLNYKSSDADLYGRNNTNRLGDKKWIKKSEEKTLNICENKDKEKIQDSLEMASSASESDKEEIESFQELSRDPKTAAEASATDTLQKVEAPITTSLLTEEQMNQLGAQIVKAELLGDAAKAKQLKEKLEEARNAKSKTGLPTTAATGSRPSQSKVELLMTRDRFGNVRPVMGGGGRDDDVREGKAGRKRRAKETHKNGERQKYFADDDEQSLEQMVRREKMNAPEEDSFKKYARLAAKMTGAEDDFDDRLVESVAGRKSNLMDSREKQLAIIEQKRMASKLDACKYCFDNIEKHLIVAIGSKSILCLPRYRSMVDGHCLIIPMRHVTQMTQCDEDVAADIDNFVECLSRLYKSQGKGCVVMETCVDLKKCEHCVIECVPMPVDLISSCPMYFKKAILEIGSEWAQNKKLVEVKGRKICNAVPVGFPYFWVSFGLAYGYAHIIEDKSFSSYFGREIIGGMLDLDPFLWRKPHIDSFEKQRSKTVEFSKIFKNFELKS